MFSAPSIDRERTTQFDLQKRVNWPTLLLGFLACLLLADSIYAALVLPQAPGRMAEPSADLIARLPFWSFVVALPLPVPRQSYALALTLFVTCVVKFAAYALAIYVAWTQPCSMRRLVIVVGAALLFFVLAVVALPNINRDIYNYILSGRVAAVYGANPYESAPNRFPDDALYRYASARYTDYAGDNKMPVWMLLNVALARLGGDNPVANLLLYRSVFLLFNIGNLALIAWILHIIRPQLLLAGLVIYAWNPIIAVYGQSKVDTVMVFFLLLAVLALLQEKRRLAFVVLGVSALVKLISLPLLAVYWLYTMRSRGARELAISTALLALTALAFYAPFWYGPELLRMQLRLLGDVANAGPSLARMLVYTGFMVAVLWVGLSRYGRADTMLSGWTLVMVLFALFVTKLGFSWYLMTMIAVASLAVERRFTPIVVLLSFVSFLLNALDTASNEVVQLPVLFTAPRFSMQLLFIGVSVLGLAVLEIAQRARQRRVEYSVERG
ncbi:MAG: hypothetical protein ABIV47_16950 [Roseiflexaceae bacterium]